MIRSYFKTLRKTMITETELEFKFATQAKAPSGLMAMPTGKCPTGPAATTELLAVSITET